MHIIIFGATSGIGKALANLYIEKGHRVAITGRRLNKLQEIQKTNPTKFLIKQHDVTDITSSEKVFKELVNELKTVDLVIYSSGIGLINPELTWEKEMPTIETNGVGAARIFGLAFQVFEQQGYGHIVGISSISGLRGNRQAPAYSSTKAFVSNYLESLWFKSKRSKANIHVTDIIPGFVDTAMAKGDTFWMATPQKAARQIYSAIKRKKKRAYITKRWRLIALLFRILPARSLVKM